MFIFSLPYRHIHKLPELLESTDLDVRIAGGESISLLYELAREQDEVNICVNCNMYQPLH